MKITIVYQSRRGKTASYARAMAMFLWQQGISVSLCATSDFTAEKLEHCDCLMLGCWTSGWFVVNQHPNPIWREFAHSHLQGKLPARIVLFTTYKFRTGSMFRRMSAALNLTQSSIAARLQSKTGILSDSDKSTLLHLVKNISNPNQK